MPIHRRDFLKQGAGALASPLIATALPSAALGALVQADSLARIGIATWSFRHLMAAGRNEKMPPPERAVMTALDAPKFVREELGLRQLEIIINHLDERTVAYAERVRAAANAVGVQFINFQLGGQMSAQDPAVRAKSIDDIKEGMRIAAALGSPTVRADVGGKQGEPLDLSITADSYKQLVEFGSTIGVMPMPENHGGHSTDPDTLVSIMRAIDPRIRAIVDWGNFRVETQAQRVESTRKLLPYTGLVSAKFDRFDADYRPSYDVAELVRLVEASGYQGKYSIEITNNPPDIVRAARGATEIIRANFAGNYTMSTITVGKENSTSIDLYYEDHGSGSPVVLIHGWPLSGASWEKQTAALLAAGHRVITYDRRGFGRSSKPGIGYNYDTFAADLDKLLRKLKLKKVALVGFSMGSGEVTRYLGKYGSKRVRKAVLIGTLGPYLVKAPGNPEGVDGKVFEDIKAAIRADRPAFLMEFLRNFYNYDVTGGTLVSERVLEDNWNVAAGASAIGTVACVDCWIEDFRKDVTRNKVPTLILHGDADRILPPEATSRRQARMIRNVRFVELPGGPHGVLWTHADRINSELVSFLAK